MKKYIKCLAAITAVFLLVMPLFCAPLTASADYYTEYPSSDLLTALPASTTPQNATDLNIKAKAAVLMEPHTGQVLYAQNADEKLAPASITKIMSLLLIMEAIESGKLTTQTKVSCSEHAASMGGSQIWLEVNETMTVDELLRASVIASANDATVALAEAVAGSEEAFVKKMNEKAVELGMKNTTFINACGLDADGHQTTARDVAIMSAALIKHELIKKYSTVWMDALRGGKSELVNTNKLVRYYDGATGLKTGTTSKAGCCVSATAKRGDLELVAVIMGGENSNERFSGAKKLLDYGFANWSFLKISPKLENLNQIEIKNGMESSITADCGGAFLNLLIEKGGQDKITQTITIKENLTAPVLAGDIIGTVTFTMDGKQVGELPLRATQTVDAINFINSFITLISAMVAP